MNPGRLLLNSVTKDLRDLSRGKGRLRIGPGIAGEVRQEFLECAATFASICGDAEPFIIPIDAEFGLSGGYSLTVGELKPPYPVTAIEVHFDTAMAEEQHCRSAVILCIDAEDGRMVGGSEAAFLIAAVTLEEGIPRFINEVLIIPRGPFVMSAMDDGGVRLSEGGQVGEFGLPEGHPEFEPMRGRFLRIVMDFLCLLSCENVRCTSAPISEIKRQMDRDKNAGRFLIYRTLVLPGGQLTCNGFDSNVTTERRYHKVRGHIRRLPSGRNTWVKAHARGYAHKGVIEKDYRVAPPLPKASPVVFGFDKVVADMPGWDVGWDANGSPV